MRSELSYKSAVDNHQLAQLPGSYGPPVIGHTFALVKDLYGAIDRHYQQYGVVSRFGLAGFKGVLLLGADLVREVLQDPDNNYSAEMGYRRSLGRYYLGALLLQDQQEHRFQRRMLQTAFKAEAMRGYVQQMGPMVARGIADWPSGERFVCFPSLKQLLLDIAAEVFLGLSPTAEDARRIGRAYTDVAAGLMAIVIKEIPGTRHARAKKQERFLKAYLTGLIAARRSASGSDIFSYLCREQAEDGQYFSAEDICTQMSFLLFAAHDTTASALSHVLFHLGQDMTVQERLREEMLALPEGQPGMDTLEQMPLTDAAIKEALRLHPSVMLMQRRTIRDCELGGYAIPANTLLFLAPQHNHRMAEYWHQPECFDIDRWLPPRDEHKSHSHAFIGFGGGAHKCIGMHFALLQSKIFLYHFLRCYRFQLTGRKHKLQTLPLPKPADNLAIRLEPLKNRQGV